MLTCFYLSIFHVNFQYMKLCIYLFMEEIKSSVLMNGFLCMSAQVAHITFILQQIISC